MTGASRFGNRTAEEYQRIGAELAAWLEDAAIRSELSDVFLDLPPVPRVTARDVRLAWLGAPADDASDMLAELALDVVEERDAERAVRCATMALTSEQNPATDARRRRDDPDEAAKNLPGPDITTDATYRRDVIAFLKRIGRCRPEWEGL